MLTLQNLSLENFGPYKGQQNIEFPTDGGVVIVYGENMRGKTTLLNAIRYAFFGTVLTRREARLTLANIENWESADEGKHGFKVILSFEHDEANYKLTRECRIRRDVSTPQTDSDYEQLCFLQRNGNALGPEEANDELVRIMPEGVSRFFLFDGELLQQYEELLRDESDMGKRIKESIERILGVPVLTKARTTVKRLLDEAQKAESKAAQRGQETQELGNNHMRLIEERTGHESEISRLTLNCLELKAKKRGLEDEVKKYERLFTLFNERERLNREVKEIDRKRTEKEIRLKEVMANAWRGVLSQKFEDAQAAFESKREKLQSVDSRKAAALYLISMIDQGISAGECPTCNVSLNATSQIAIDRFKLRLTQESEQESDTTALSDIISKINILKDVNAAFSTQLVQELTIGIQDFRFDKYSITCRLSEIEESTRSLDESEHRRINSDYDNTIKDISLVEQGIQKEREALTKVEQDIERVQRKLDQLGGADLSRDRRRREVAKRLYDLLNEAVDVYRNQLRQRVERDASELFRKLTTEQEYTGLQINENYGLRILHTDGTVIPVRSAGAEHIVALSLMGALQKNAPLQGPIIMDSPFGRLDDQHTTKVVESLPDMASQVMLLVYESEMEPRLARDRLQGHLKREYRILRVSARHSKIEERHD
ncbi:MAG: AAA family ATPase [Planctomycetota bacterium]